MKLRDRAAGESRPPRPGGVILRPKKPRPGPLSSSDLAGERIGTRSGAGCGAARGGRGGRGRRTALPGGRGEQRAQGLLVRGGQLAAAPRHRRARGAEERVEAVLLAPAPVPPRERGQVLRGEPAAAEEVGPDADR